MEQNKEVKETQEAILSDKQIPTITIAGADEEIISLPKTDEAERVDSPKATTNETVINSSLPTILGETEAKADAISTANETEVENSKIEEENIPVAKPETETEKIPLTTTETDDKATVIETDEKATVIETDENATVIETAGKATTIETAPKPLIYNLIKRSHRPKVQEVQDEGKDAIDSPGSPTSPDLPPQEYILDENEERSMIEPQSYLDPKLKELMAVLMEWINDELASQRIIIKDLEEDLYDGQVLQKLMEKLTGVRLDVVEVTQNEEGQKQKLKMVLDAVQKWLGLGRWSTQKWSVDAIHSKNLVAILHLLVSLARHFRAPVRLTENVVINLVVVQKAAGILQTRRVPEEITTTYDDLGLRFDRDAFDTLFDHAPDKLQVVKKSLVTFVNKHLNKINLEVNDLDTQFHDGVYLILLFGLLEGYFVPLNFFYLTPTTFEQKVHNVAFAFELSQDAGLLKPKARPEDVVNGDLKSTLRVLYNMFTKYKHLELGTR